MNDLSKQLSFKQRLLQTWQQRSYLKRQLKRSLHPQLIQLFINSLFHSHHYLEQHSVKKQPLSTMPICLVLGESQTGKSSLLDNAGFPFYPTDTLNSRYQPMAARSMPQFRHTQHKLYVELPAYLFINESNKHLPYLDQTLAFFKDFHYFQKTREIIYTISLEKVLSDDEFAQKQRDEFFANLSTLLSKIPAPVHCYIVVTKVDRLLGFSEFFDDLSIEERQMACGISLNQAPILNTFQRQFQHLAQRLTERLFWRCHGEHQLKRRLLVADYPQQFIHAESYLSQLIQRFDELSQVIPQLKMRGLYWVSNVQQGNLIDLLNNQNIALRNNQNHQNLPLLWHRKTFFTRGFFQHLSSSHLTRTKTPFKTKPAVKAKRHYSALFKKILVTLIAAPVLVFTLYMSYQHYLNETALTPLEQNPALAYALLTANDTKQALQAYINHAAPNLSTERQQRLVNDPQTLVHLRQLTALYLNQMWQSQVLSFYQQQLAQHYPLDSHAKTDADLKAFSAFYGPKGLLDHFQKEYLSHASAFESKDLNPQAQLFFDRVHQLQRLLFNEQGQLAVAFNLSPSQLGSDIHQVDLDITGIQLSAKPHAIVNEVFYWPNNLNIHQSSFVIEKIHGVPQSFSRQGPWSWLALLQQFHCKDFSQNSDGDYEGYLVLNSGDVQLNLSSKQDLSTLLTLFNSLIPPHSLL